MPLQRLAFAALLPLGALSHASAQTTVTMWTFLDPAKQDGRSVALRQMIAQYEAAHPNVKIKVEPQVWSTLGEKFVLSQRTGTGPDIAWVNSENLGLVLGSNSAADLAAVTRKWTAKEWADFRGTSALKAAAAGNRQLALPLMLSSSVLMYRKDAFKAAGVEPGSIKTWEDLGSAAARLAAHGAKEGKGPTWGMGLALSQERAVPTPLVLRLLDEQGELFDKDCRPRLATEAGVKALTWQVDALIKTKAVSPEDVSKTSDDNFDAFAAGRAAMIPGNMGRYDKTRSEATWGADNLGILPWPSSKPGREGPQPVLGWYLVMSPKSKVQGEAMKFMEYMVKGERAYTWTTLGGQVPLWESTWERAELKEPRYEWMRQVSAMWAKSGVSINPACDFSRVFGDLNLATQRLASGKMTAREALKAAEATTLERNR